MDVESTNRVRASVSSFTQKVMLRETHDLIWVRMLMLVINIPCLGPQRGSCGGYLALDGEPDTRRPVSGAILRRTRPCTPGAAGRTRRGRLA